MEKRYAVVKDEVLWIERKQEEQVETARKRKIQP